MGRDGTIFVADTGNHRVQVFSNNRQYLGTIGVTGATGSDNTHFNQPVDVAVDTAGNAYVSDLNNHRVQKCNRTSSLWACVTIAGETSVSGSDFGHLSSPTAVTVDAEGRSTWPTSGRSREVFDTIGAYLTTVGGSWAATLAKCVMLSAWRWTHPAISMWLRRATTTASRSSRPACPAGGR